MIASLVAAGLLISVTGYAALWGRLVGQPIAASLISACCCIVCTLFGGALLGVLYPAEMVAFFGGFVALFGWWRRSKPAEIRAVLLQPAPMIFFVVFVGFFVFSRGMLLIYWDEFATWATNSKYLLTTDRFPVAGDAVLYADYPPGDALFQYFVTRLSGFSEDNLIFAHAIFQTAALLPILAAVRWKNVVLLVSLILIGWVAGYLFGESNLSNWTSIIVDNEVGYLFAATFAIYFLGGCDLRAIICAAPVAVALALTKQVGLLFALVFAMLVLADRLAAATWNGLAKARITASEGAACLALFVLPIGANALWFEHLRRANLRLVYTWQTAYDHITASNFGVNTVAILSTFVDLVEGHFAISAGGLGFPLWMAALGVLATASVVTQDTSEHRLRVFAVHLVMAGSLVLYLVFLTSLYVFAYPANGGLELQSFTRYLGSFLVAWMGIGLVSLIHEWRPRSRRFFVVPLVALIACGALYATRKQVHLSLVYHARGDARSEALLEMRANVKARIGSIGDLIPPDSPVYSVWNGTNGLLFSSVSWNSSLVRRTPPALALARPGSPATSGAVMRQAPNFERFCARTNFFFSARPMTISGIDTRTYSRQV